MVVLSKTAEQKARSAPKKSLGFGAVGSRVQGSGVRVSGFGVGPLRVGFEVSGLGLLMGVWSLGSLLAQTARGYLVLGFRGLAV